MGIGKSNCIFRYGYRLKLFGSKYKRKTYVILRNKVTKNL